MDRYTSLAPQLKLPKGAKTVEHERHNRASNPCYGSLAPRKDRPNRAEYTYDPLARYVALARSLRTPKGTTSREHQEVMRTSNPLRLSRRARYFAQAAARGELGNGNKKKGEGESSESDDELPELPWLPSPRLEPARSGERCSDTDSDASFARTERASNSIEALGLDEFSLKSAHSSGEKSTRSFPAAATTTASSTASTRRSRRRTSSSGRTA